MRLVIMVDLTADDGSGTEFQADAGKTIRIDRTATKNDVYAQIIGALSPMVDKAASDFVAKKGLLKNA